MADTAEEIHDRRRRRRNSTETDSESNQEDPYTAPADESVLDTSTEVTEDAEAENSEYESAEEEQDDVTGTEGSEEETETVDEQTYDETTDDDIDSRLDESICSEIVDEERQSGDGQEQPDELKTELDDDEDAKNPAYIPRKGAFYEHDNRQGEEVQGEEEVRPKRPLWKDEGRWLHDLFKTDLQAPKSREELIALYGYDIRSRDTPPEEPPRYLRRGRGRRGGQDSRKQLRDFMPADQQRDMREPSRRGSPRGGRGGGFRGMKPPPGDRIPMNEDDFPHLQNSQNRPPPRDIKHEPQTPPRPQNVHHQPDLEYQTRPPQKPSEGARPLRGKQWTNSTYRQHNQIHNDPRNQGPGEPTGPPPQAQVPSHERRSNRAVRGRGGGARTLPDRMAGLHIDGDRLPDPGVMKNSNQPPVKPEIKQEIREPQIPKDRPPDTHTRPMMQGAGDASAALRHQQQHPPQPQQPPVQPGNKDNRPKRYSTQRQRAGQEQPPYQADQVQSFYPPGFAPPAMYQPSTGDVTYPTTVFSGQTAPYPVPAGAPGMPAPPRLFPQQTNVSMSPLPPTGPPPGIMTFPPAGVPGPVPAPVPQGVSPGAVPGAVPGQMMGYMMASGQMPPPGLMNTGMPVSGANSPQQQNLQEFSHGGTTYYTPHQHAQNLVQTNQQRQAMRSKKAIPIVRPQDVHSSSRDSQMRGPENTQHPSEDDRERTPTNFE